jgi:hypothetical protein
VDEEKSEERGVVAYSLMQLWGETRSKDLTIGIEDGQK